jgi:hypothetical protein
MPTPAAHPTRNRLPVRLVVGFCCGWLACAGAVAAAPTSDASDSDPLLLSFRLGRQTLADVVPALADGEDVLLPLGEFCRLLEEPVDVDPDLLSAAGRLGEAGPRFHLDVARREAEIDGRRTTVPADSLRPFEGDLYVSSRLLSSWFQVTIRVDRQFARVDVEELAAAPRTLRLERERSHLRLGASDGSGEEPDVATALAFPRRMLALPAVDFDLRAAAGRGEGFDTRFSSYLTGEVAHLDAAVFATGSSASGETELRWTLGRVDPAGGLLGPLHAREALAGEILLPGSDLTALSANGPGLLISNRPADQPTRFDRQDFRGPLPPGWQVELYRGDELIGFSNGDGSGNYDISDVPLSFGSNDFRLVFYGPRGEHLEERRSYEVGRGQVPRGQLYYRLGASQPRGRDPRAVLDAAYGLSERSTLTAATSAVELPDGRHDYADLGWTTSFDRLLARLDTAHDLAGGTAVRGSLFTRVGGLAINLDHTRMSDFESEVYDTAYGRVDSSSHLRLDGLWSSARRTFPLTLDLRDDSLAAGGRVVEASARVSSLFGSIFLSQQLRYRDVDRPSDRSRNLGGSLLFSRFGRRLTVRGQLDVEHDPDWQLSLLSLSGELRLSRGRLLVVGLTRTPAAAQTLLDVELRRTEGRFGYGLGVQVDGDGGVRGTATLVVGAAPRADSVGWNTDARPTAALAALEFHAFLDLDGDGRREAGEPPVAGVALHVDGLPSRARTATDGTLYFGRLRTLQALALEVDETSLSDPLWVPGALPASVVLRPGTVERLEVPIVATNELIGTLYVRREGAPVPATGLRVQLVAASGAVAAETRTASDGYFDLVHVLPGRYRMRIEPDQAARLGVRDATLRDLSLPYGGLVLDGLDSVLEAGDPAPRTPATRIASVSR